ncbi:MAG: amino acid ABC transporter permease [Aquihabitans sp.]
MTGPIVTPPTSPADPDAVPDLYRSGRRKRQRSRTRRWLAYLIGIVLVVAFATLADWATIGRAYFNVAVARDMFPEVVAIAAKNTLIYTVCSFIGGTVLGLTMALLRLSSIRAYRWFAAIYIEIFRGLPALLTITIVGFLTPIALGISFPKIFGVNSAGIVALSLVAGAYLAETIRAGIQAVPKGQVEAARSLGMSHTATMRSVVIPQAFRVVIPPLTNEMVLLLKDTSLLSVLGVTIQDKELMKFGKDVMGEGFNGTPLIVVGVLYLVITIPLTQLVAVLERRNAKAR